MTNVRVHHRFTITKAADKGSAYLLSSAAEWDHTPWEKGGYGEFTAWTTLAAAKRVARESCGRLRLAWQVDEDAEGTMWSASCVQVLKEET